MSMDKAIKGGLISSAMSAGSSALGGLFGWIGQKKQRKYEREMYERQLADNRQNWELENFYNSPEQQMKRLKEAGLNPNLVYGNGADAQGGQITGANPNVSDQSKFLQPASDQLSKLSSSAINQMYDLRQRDAQLDLTREQVQTQNTIQELNAVTAGLKSIAQQSDQMKLDIGRETYDTTIKMANAALQAKLQEILQSQETTRTQQTQQSLNRQNERTSKSQQMLNELEQELIKLGYNKGDSAQQRLFKKIMNIIYLNQD